MSFDAIGDIAVIETGTKAFGKQFLKAHPFFRAVYRRTSMLKGTFRVPKLTLLAGEKRTLAEHKESGLRMLVDVAKTYFSPRLSAERLRIAHLIEPNEHVLVLFGGVAPYALVFAKHTKAAHITSVELNPEAHKLAQHNIALNKYETRITAIKADVKRWTTRDRFDRIVMPLPLTGSEFLAKALRLGKPRATVHFYTFAHDTAFNAATKPFREACKKAKMRCTVQRIVKVGQSSPHIYRICIDATIRT